MLSISLLPKKYRQHTLLKKRQRMLVLLFTFLSVMLFLFLGFLLINNGILQNQLDNTFAYQKNLESQVKSLAPYEKIYRQIEKTGRIAGEVKGGQMDWQGFLIQLGGSLPQGVIFTDLNATNPKNTGPGEVRIRGKAKNQMTVAGFLGELEQFPQISDLQCRFINLAYGEDSETQFEITFKVSQK